MIGEQLTFPELERHMSYSRNYLGTAGEVWAARALEAAGYKVRLDHQRGDLTAITKDGEILYVEVKTARQGKDKKWRFTLYKYWQKRLCTDHNRADFVILLCVLKPGCCVPFVVPTDRLSAQRQAVITSHPDKYAGKLSLYRQPAKRITLYDQPVLL
jgi:hypothetical protein